MDVQPIILSLISLTYPPKSTDTPSKYTYYMTSISIYQFRNSHKFILFNYTIVIFLELTYKVFGPSQAHFDLDSGQQHIYALKNVLYNYAKMHGALVSQTYIVSVTVGAHFINSVGVEKLLHKKVFPLTYSHLWEH